MNQLFLLILTLSVFVESVTVGPIRIGRILAVCAVVVAVLVIAARPQRRVSLRPAVGLPVAGLTLWMLVSMFWADSPGSWREAMLQLALALCYFVAYVVLLESRDQVRQLLTFYALGAAAAAVVGILQAAPETRAVGFQGDPNIYALYELAALPIVMVKAGMTTGVRRLLWSAASCLLIWSVLAAQSRGALLAAAFVLLWLLWRGDLGGTLARYRFMAVMAGATALLILASWAIATLPRFDPEKAADDRGSGRIDIWLVAWHTWEENPLLGLGAGEFKAQSSGLLTTTPGVELDTNSIYAVEPIMVHNAYLEPLVDLGPVGLFLYLALLAGAARGLKLPRDGPRRDLLGLAPSRPRNRHTGQLSIVIQGWRSHVIEPV